MFGKTSTFVCAGVALMVSASPGARAQTIINNQPAPAAQPAPAPAPAVVTQPAPQPVEAQPSSPVVIAPSAGQDVTYHPRVGLIAGGATLFGATYLVTVLGGAIAADVCQSSPDYALGCRTSSWPIYIPVVGPFAQMGYIEGPGQNTGRALLAIDGVLQAGGLTLMIVGLATGFRRAPAAYSQRLQISPYTGASGGGLALSGHF